MRVKIHIQNHASINRTWGGEGGREGAIDRAKLTLLEEDVDVVGHSPFRTRDLLFAKTE